MGFSNELSQVEAEWLAILMEECAEVQQAVGKILRHGWESRHPEGGPTNRVLLEKELGHVLYALEMCVEAQDLDYNSISLSRENKAMTIAQYLHHQDPGAL